MVTLRYETWQHLILEEFSKLSVPAGPARRNGVEAYAAKVIDYIARDIQGLHKLLEQDQIQASKAAAQLTELALEAASFLYASGAEHPTWRRWAGLTACGMLLTDDIYGAAQYAALGGEWDLIPQLPSIVLTSSQVSDRVLGRLLGITPAADLPDAADDEYDEAWLQLARSIPERDHPATEDALKTIADFWIEETEGDWINFHVRSSPDFDTPSCVAAALARRSGFAATAFSDEEYQFLEAGLVESEPPALFPGYFTFPSFERS
jgi:hypothetical protein